MVKPKSTLDRLAALQRKLSRRMIKGKSKDGTGNGGQDETSSGEDPKVAQWVALQVAFALQGMQWVTGGEKVMVWCRQASRYGQREVLR